MRMELNDTMDVASSGIDSLMAELSGRDRGLAGDLFAGPASGDSRFNDFLGEFSKDLFDGMLFDSENPGSGLSQGTTPEYDGALSALFGDMPMISPLAPSTATCGARAGQDPLADIETKALLSQSVYQDSGAPEGWQRVNDTPEALREMGLDPGMFELASQGFHAALYENDGQYVLAFRGTQPESLVDWKHNAQQGLGYTSQQYEQAILLAQNVKQAAGGQLEITGHSLGGGLGSAAAAVTNTRAMVFNPAGVHPNTLEPYGIERSDVDDLITAVKIDGEILTGVQENPLVDAAGLAATPFKYAYQAVESLGEWITGREVDPDFDPVLAYEAIGREIELPGMINGREADFSWWNAKHNLETAVELHGMDAVLESIRHQTQ